MGWGSKIKKAAEKAVKTVNNTVKVVDSVVDKTADSVTDLKIMKVAVSAVDDVQDVVSVIKNNELAMQFVSVADSLASDFPVVGDFYNEAKNIYGVAKLGYDVTKAITAETQDRAKNTELMTELYTFLGWR